jgi:hypothetical protein
MLSFSGQLDCVREGFHPIVAEISAAMLASKLFETSNFRGRSTSRLSRAAETFSAFINIKNLFAWTVRIAYSWDK